MADKVRTFWMARARRWWSDVPQSEDRLRRRWYALARLTDCWLRRHGFGGLALGLMPDDGDELAWRFQKEIRFSSTGRVLPRDERMAELWAEWEREYQGLLERRPRIALRESLSEISEGYDSSSWPTGYEEDLLTWVDGGDYDRRPGQWAIIERTPRELYERLVDLRRREHGWWWWDHEVEKPVWRSEGGEHGA